MRETTKKTWAQKATMASAFTGALAAGGCADEKAPDVKAPDAISAPVNGWDSELQKILTELKEFAPDIKIDSSIPTPEPSPELRATYNSIYSFLKKADAGLLTAAQISNELDGIKEAAKAANADHSISFFMSLLGSQRRLARTKEYRLEQANAAQLIQETPPGDARAKLAMDRIKAVDAKAAKVDPLALVRDALNEGRARLTQEEVELFLSSPAASAPVKAPADSVSASTKKLPELPSASELRAGISNFKHADADLAADKIKEFIDQCTQENISWDEREIKLTVIHALVKNIFKSDLPNTDAAEAILNYTTRLMLDGYTKIDLEKIDAYNRETRRLRNTMSDAFGAPARHR